MGRRQTFYRKVRGWFACAIFLSATLLSRTQLFAKTVTLTSIDNGTPICLIEGDTLMITLSSPIADSYKWQYQLAKPSPLTALNDDFNPAKTPNGLATQTFRFNAASTGDSALTLSFQRQKPGAGPQVTQTFSVQVSIASGVPKSLVLVGTYKGSSTCADCTGIVTVLRLYAKGSKNFSDCIYISTRTYQGGRNGDQSFTDRGDWYLDKGDAVDPNATVYALSPDDPQRRQYYLLQSEGASLTGLDSQMKPIDAPPQYQTILKRVE